MHSFLKKSTDHAIMLMSGYETTGRGGGGGPQKTAGPPPPKKTLVPPPANKKPPHHCRAGRGNVTSPSRTAPKHFEINSEYNWNV